LFNQYEIIYTPPKTVKGQALAQTSLLITLFRENWKLQMSFRMKMHFLLKSCQHGQCFLMDLHVEMVQGRESY